MGTARIETPLCELAYKYGTDKCPRLWHVYTPFYYELFKDRRESVRKIVEIGIGYKRPVRMHEKVEHYRPGASLKMWRDFFPNAEIHGADIAQRAMIVGENRISTWICNETSREDLIHLLNTIGTDVDLFVDDGSHYYKNQIFLCDTVLPLLDEGVTYIIEDVIHSRQLKKALEPKFKLEIPDLEGRIDVGGKLVVVHR